MRTSRRLRRLSSVTILLALAAMVMSPTTSLAASGIFASFVIVNNNGGGNAFYDLSSSTGNPDFQGANLGTFGCGETLVIAGGQIRTYKNSGSNVTGADIYYRITKQGNSPGSFTNIDLPFKSDDGGGDQTWEKANNTTDVLVNLGPGTYDFEVYGEAQSSDGAHYVNNGGSNYKATFTVRARTVSGSGSWNAGATWVGGAVPAANVDVEICSGSTVTLDIDPTVRSIKINSGATLQDDSTANTLTVAGTSAANPNFTNSGTFTAGSGTVVASGTTSFVTIKDDATTPNTLYYGVDIVNGSALGPTTVKISGSQDTCPYVNSGSRPVKRCYYFNVQNAASPQVVFYYEYAELRSGQDPATLNVWKDNGNGTWTKITPSARSACTSGMINCSVTVSSLTEGMGPLMVVGANRYVIMSSNPQAVTLADFYVAQQGDAVLVTWETASELENRGFNLYRGTSAVGPDRQLNETLIPSQSQGNPGGFVYTWEDRADLVPGTTYYYWVEDVDIYGAVTMHGPVSVDFVAPTAVTLSDVSASPAAGAAVQAAGLLLALLAPLAGAVAVRRRGHG